MRFLVICKQVHPVPMEAAIPTLEALRAWAKQNTANKKLEQAFSFAGLTAGGGIANVNSFEELDTLMAEFPLNQWATVEIYALVDIDKSLVTSIDAIKKMMPPKR